MAKFDAGDRQVPIRVQLEDSARSDLQMLQQLRVPLGQRGERGGVPLSVVADIQLDQGPTSINRYDRERQATVAADLVGNAALGDATKMIYDLPVMKSLPKGVKVSPSGDAESLDELSEGFATAITAGLMMVYAVLVLLFGTFLQPITILFSLPLSIGGAIAALLLTGKQLTTPVWIGILMLMGIVTKNAIMLVEFAVEAIREGKKRDEAIIDAGMKRARPIVMTTIAMAAGMMPSALAFGAGGEFRSPMALAVIGGLIFSTILSLVFVPAMFMVMDDLGALCWRFGQKLLVSSGEPRKRSRIGSSQRTAGQGPARGAAGDVACGEVRGLHTCVCRLPIVLPSSSRCVPDVQNFYRVSHPIEDLVGITDDKYYPHIGIIRPITAVWMVFELGYCLANACRTFLAPLADRLSSIRLFALGRRRPRAYSVSSSVVALVGFGNDSSGTNSPRSASANPSGPPPLIV